MRLPSLLFLSLLLAAPFLPSHAAQASTPPPSRPAPPALDCVVLIPVQVPDQNQQYAKIRFGDEILSGCLGPAGPCYFALYVPC